jgi:uncharacterized membrane protein
MTYQFLSGFHIGAAISALVFGLCVFLTRKGTRLHKQFGYAYFFNMLGLNISALFIYRLTGHFGPFHGAALASLLTLMAGFTAVYLRLPQGRWLELHYEFMNWSYVGLVAAGVSEATTRLPSAPFWPAVFAGTVIVFVIGGVLIGQGRGKNNFDRLASAKRTAAPLSIPDALRRRGATCH